MVILYLDMYLCLQAEVKQYRQTIGEDTDHINIFTAATLFQLKCNLSLRNLIEAHYSTVAPLCSKWSLHEKKEVSHLFFSHWSVHKQ